MDKEKVVADEQPAVISEGQEAAAGEKLVPVSEAIRYRKRAQAAEKELGELKELHEKQGEEFEQLKQEVELLKTPSGPSTPSPLRGTPPLQGESLSSTVKTQGVKETRTGGARTMLQTAAKQAAHSGSRTDVQEYLRIRRSFV